MKKIKIALKNGALLALLISSFIACDKDFSTIGADILGADNFTTASEKYQVITYNKKLDPVQTNNLPVNYLGFYNDPISQFGSTTANFASQMSASALDPTFGDNVVLDSVILTVPYFSTATTVDENGTTLYELDSVFGTNPINLSIYENTFFLRDFDPNASFDAPQNYYADRSTSDTDIIGESLLEGQLIESIPNFVPSNDQIILTDADGEVTERLTPALRIPLDNDFWQQKILDKEGEPELSNQNNFNDYFRGIYFKAEAITTTSGGTMALINFTSTNANITLYYTRDSSVNTGERDNATYALTFSGNRVNFLSNDNLNLPFTDEGDPTNGDANLYLKGGQGSMAVVNLFGGDDNGLSTDFNNFKDDFVETDVEGNFVKSKRLVNEANLVFHVDQSIVQGEEPNRIFIYDMNNNLPLSDYFLDTSNATLTDFSIINHLGRLQRVDDEPEGEGIKYKIRLTEHINNILLRDSTNVKLGLVVSGNVNLESNTSHFNVRTDNTQFDRLPVSSIITPRGTVLYGNNIIDDEKKVSLEIFYTEPTN